MEQECKLIREKECDGEVLKRPAFACRETALVRATKWKIRTNLPLLFQ